jgi:GNAT superfamily N-acetyltransferase
MLRNSNFSDAGEVTNIHYSSEVAGILGKLSPLLLRENFYIPLLSDPKILCISKVDINHSIQGFLAYRSAASQEVFSLPRRTPNLYLDVFRVIFTNPAYISVILNVLLTERRSGQLLKRQNLHYGEIQILIVRKDSQGIGIGSELMENLIRTANWSNMIVKTQSEDAKLFYMRLGFVQIMERKLLGSKIFVLLLRKV